MSSTLFFSTIFLGIVQGITEFLPISSSGHLVLVQHFLGESLGQDERSASGLQMNLALHLGTLGSILVVYRKDLAGIIRNALREPRTIVAIGTATVPVVIVGLGLKDFIEPAFENPMLAGCGLLFTSFLLLVSQRTTPGNSEIETVALTRAATIGVFQAIAITPGISRSGSTISAALLCGMTREESARFSFLMAIPAIAGAVILKSRDLLEQQVVLNSSTVISLLIGVVTSFAVGWVSLRWLLSLLSHGKLGWFGIYCGAVGLLTVVSVCMS